MSDYLLTRFSSKPAHILWLLFSVILLLGVAFFSIHLKTSKQLGEWREYSTLEVKKASELEKIISNIGYGGFIHAFKNAVIRADEQLLIRAQQQLLAANEAIERYYALSGQDKEQLAFLQDTLHEYGEKIPVARAMIRQGRSVVEIDNAVEVDDSHAVQALSSLLTINRTSSPEIIQRSFVFQAQFSQIIWCVFVLLSALISLSFFYIWRTSCWVNNQYTQLKLVVDLIPNALLTANDQGIITSLNQEASKLFGIDKSQCGGLCVDDLVPDRYKKQHQKHREAFQNSGRTLPMSDRSKTFYGRKTNGEEFPAAISIATYSIEQSKNSIIVVKDLTEEHELKSQARTDSLTHANNRRAFDDALLETINRHKRVGRAFSLALIDIDDFKIINDTMGHEYGDEVLVRLAQRVAELIRSTDFFARWGGEEFALIMEATNVDGALEICEKIRAAVEQLFLHDSVTVTISLGIAEHREEMGAEQLVDCADKALYQSKQQGKNQTSVYHH